MTALLFTSKKVTCFMGKKQKKKSLLYFLLICTICRFSFLCILVDTTATGIPLIQSVTKYLARDIFLEDIDNGFLWLFRIPLRLYICINYFIFHLSTH